MAFFENSFSTAFRNRVYKTIAFDYRRSWLRYKSAWNGILPPFFHCSPSFRIRFPLSRAVRIFRRSEVFSIVLCSICPVQIREKFTSHRSSITNTSGYFIFIFHLTLVILLLKNEFYFSFSCFLLLPFRILRKRIFYSHFSFLVKHIIFYT